MDFEQIKYEKSGAVALITLNRPERMNAWTYRMRRELHDAMTDSNNDPAIGAIIVTGEGRGFCAGADMEAIFKARMAGEDPEAEGVPGLDWVKFVRSCKPLIAAVNGPAIGLGLSQILSFDVIVVSRTAKLAVPFVKVGVVPELGSSHFLVQRMGFGRASEFVLSARTMLGEEAVETGLADRLAEPEEVLNVAREIAETIAANPDPHLAWAKQLLTENGSETDLVLVQQREHDCLDQAYASAEHKEAVDAFLNKRKPNFRPSAA